MKHSHWLSLLFKVAMSSALFQSCRGSDGSVRQPSSVREAISPQSQPSRLGLASGMNLSLDSLPLTGKSSRPVWSGDWWPNATGGTSRRTGAEDSPMEKYDKALGQGSLATDWERKSSGASAGVSWAGHCNGLAGAGINQPEPKKAVTYNGVTFTPQDIKGLLVEAYQGVERVSLVGNRCQSAPSTGPYGRFTDAACRSLNPGALHVILANALGLHGEPFIVDIAANEQVWNYPVVSFSTKWEPIDRLRALALIGIPGASYLPNPDAVVFAHARTSLQLADGTRKEYEYVIEGDANDHVTGGEWVGQSKVDHPNFAWMMRSPNAENPYLNISVILDIARASF